MACWLDTYSYLPSIVWLIFKDCSMMRWTLGLFSCVLSKWHLFELHTSSTSLSSSLPLWSMSRKAWRQLREAITSISHPYSHPISCTCRAEDIITPEGSPQSTPHSIPVELPVIHEPTPVHFIGIVDPSLTHSSPEHDTFSLYWVGCQAIQYPYPVNIQLVSTWANWTRQKIFRIYLPDLTTSA
jgi:hypothetical protein